MILIKDSWAITSTKVWACMTSGIMGSDNSTYYVIQRIDCLALGIVSIPSNNLAWPERQLAERNNNMMIGFGYNFSVLLNGKGEQEWA